MYKPDARWQIIGRQWFTCLLFMSAIFLFSRNRLLAQVEEKKWEDLISSYKAGLLNDTGFFGAAQKLAERSFKDTALKTKLTLYRQLAWSKTAYHDFRLKYFLLLANNAVFAYQAGAAIYYLEMHEEELRKRTPYVNSLNQPRMLLGVYGRGDRFNYERRQQVFKGVLPFLEQLPQLIDVQKIPDVTCINAMTILNHASRLYAAVGDSGMVKLIVNMSGNIWTKLKERGELEKGRQIQCFYLYQQILYTNALLQQNMGVAKKLLDSSYTLLKQQATVNQLWVRSTERVLLKKYIDFFIQQKQPDSSRHYLNLIVQKIDETDRDYATIRFEYDAKLYALEGDYHMAYQALREAYEKNDSIIGVKTADIDNNLYAQLMAEQRAEEVVRLQEQRQKRNVTVFIMTLIAVVTILFLVIRMRHKERIASKKIEDLNKLTQIEIAELEAKANLIQRKLGMELHDDVTSELAYLCHFIDKNAIETDNTENRERLQVIASQARMVYQNTRHKSHLWYLQGATDEQLAFSQSIHKIVDQALPETSFSTTVEIDETIFKQVGHPVKIHLLRIIQASIANILKHAQANQVKISLYEDEGSVILEISDNGKGFDLKQSRVEGLGLGIQSIRERVAQLNGQIDIMTGKKGTELVVTLPLNQE
ncbi:sensor histidine kinase [Niabella sp. CJ426]|uniref:sensor histidine kinase n=1 Tax=Niabella sp. CJ426 TaxID=3393740 RepID=UPI003CFF52CF